MANDLTKEQIKELEEAMADLTATRERDLEVRKKLNAIAKNGKSDLQTEIEFLREQTTLYRQVNVEVTAYQEAILAAGDHRRGAGGSSPSISCNLR